jgi:hypothetical protein
MNAKIRSLRRRIDEIKTQIVALGDLRPGTLSQQYNVCGKLGCRCKADPPQKHGPDYQLGWTRKGRSTTRFVRLENLSEVRSEIKAYERLQALVDRWVELSMALCEIKKRTGADG